MRNSSATGFVTSDITSPVNPRLLLLKVGWNQIRNFFEMLLRKGVFLGRYLWLQQHQKPAPSCAFHSIAVLKSLNCNTFLTSAKQ